MSTTNTDAAEIKALRAAATEARKRRNKAVAAFDAAARSSGRLEARAAHGAAQDAASDAARKALDAFLAVAVPAAVAAGITATQDAQPGGWESRNGGMDEVYRPGSFGREKPVSETLIRYALTLLGQGYGIPAAGTCGWGGDAVSCGQAVKQWLNSL